MKALKDTANRCAKQGITLLICCINMREAEIKYTTEAYGVAPERVLNLNASNMTDSADALVKQLKLLVLEEKRRKL